jgi:hypothetical protein
LLIIFVCFFTYAAETIVKLGLEDIANSLQTGSVVDEAGDQASALVGGLLGQLYGQAGKYIKQ